MPPTDAEAETIGEVITEQEAGEIGRWRQAEPDQELASANTENLVQWADEDGDIAVWVERDVREQEDEEDEVRYSARAAPLADDVRFGKTSISLWNDALEDALDDAINWLRTHRPGIPLPTFEARIEGGIYIPMVDLLNRLGGGDTLFEVRDTGLHVESASHVNQVEFTIPAADFDAYDVDAEGEFVADTDSLWDAVKNANFSQTLPLSIDGTEERPRFGVAGSSSFADDAVDHRRQTIPEVFPFDAQFTIDGLEYRDKVNAARIVESESAVFGRLDGVVFINIDGDNGADEFAARLDTTSAEGEAVVLINPDRLQQLRRAMPRPSQTPITFTLKGNLPLLAEYTVGETDIDVRIALKTGAVPTEPRLPPEEITVPDEPDDDDAAERMDRALTAAAEGGDEKPLLVDHIPADSDIDRKWPELSPVQTEFGINRDISDRLWERIADAYGFTEVEPLIEAMINPGDEFRVVDNLQGVEELGREMLTTWFQRNIVNDFDVAEPVAQFFDRPSAILPGLREMDDLTDIPGIGEAGAETLREALAELEGEDVAEDRQRRSIIVDEVDGQLEFTIEGEAPPTVAREAINQATVEFVDPRDFDARDEVGQVIFRGDDIVDIGFRAGNQLLETREGMDEEPAEEPAEEPEPEPEPESEEPPELSTSEVETAIDNATLATEAAALTAEGRIVDVVLRFDLDTDVPFTMQADTARPTIGDTRRETVQNAIQRWENLINLAALDPGQVDAINERRTALNEQFDLDIPMLEAEIQAGGFTRDELTDIITRGTAGIIPDVKINPGTDSLRIGIEPDPGSSVEFAERLREVQGTASNAVAAINEAFEEFDRAVDPDTAPMMTVKREREQLEDEFDIDLLEVGDTTPERDVEEGEEPDIRLEGVWADVRNIAINQEIPLEDRELRVQERLEGRLADEYPGAFDDLFVAIRYPPGGAQSGKALEDVLELEFGGNLASSSRDRFAVPQNVNVIRAQGSVSDPKAVWDDMVTLFQIFDLDDDEFAELSEQFDTVRSMSAFRIESGRFDPDEVILTPDDIRPVASRNVELWQQVLSYMRDQSAAWWAAQRVTECAEGLRPICDQIENEIAGNTPRGWAEWYLRNAYELFLEGDWDPKLFITEWHDVFEPGETEADARSRRGEVDLETLGRPSAERQERESTVEVPDEPEPEPEPEPATPDEPEPEEPPEDFGRTVEDTFDEEVIEAGELEEEVVEEPEPQPEPAAEEPTQTVTIAVRGDGGRRYEATDDVSDAVREAIEDVARDILGPPRFFSAGDEVGTVTLRGDDVAEADLDRGREILEIIGSDRAADVTAEAALASFRDEIRERM